MVQKSGTEHRRKILRMRVSACEERALKERCPENVPFASWLRGVALGQKRQKKTKQVDPLLLKELNAIGVNLNQMARTINLVNLTGSRVELVEFIHALRAIEVRILHLLQQGES